MNGNYEEAATIGMKVVGAIAAFLSLKWVAKIFKGDDNKFDTEELKKFLAVVFFAVTGGYMLYKEGNRTHEWNIYSEWYIFIVFGSLLTALHLDGALDKIILLAKAVADIRKPKANEQQSQ